MKKLVAVICVLAMILSVPAFAAGSPDLFPVLAGVTTVAPVSEGWSIQIQSPADPEVIANPTVKDIVVAANDDEAPMTVADAVALLAQLNGVEAEEILANAEGFDFLTGFANLVLSNGNQVAFDDNGAPVQATVTMTADALKGQSVDGVQVILLNTVTGEVEFIELDPETFNADNGEITVDFPFLGSFALIKAI